MIKGDSAHALDRTKNNIKDKNFEELKGLILLVMRADSSFKKQKC